VVPLVRIDNRVGVLASFNQPNGIAVDQKGNVYVADQLNHKIRKITPAGVVTTLAGNGQAGSNDNTWLGYWQVLIIHVALRLTGSAMYMWEM
jgi:DNA-binding beta-propeller fold protein YncE